ncbi:MAG: response regulator transcription factor [Deltaproteobacteria bacterium]|nr:response regulator transcription factor [Deltaproteobacteria bacterium]
MGRCATSTGKSMERGTGPMAEAHTVTRPVKQCEFRLTAAEKRVLSLVSLARTNKEIAAALGISPATVKRHMENVLRKLQLKNRVAVAIYALRSIGCPRGPSPGCPLEVAQEEINLTREKWAV